MSVAGRCFRTHTEMCTCLLYTSQRRIKKESLVKTFLLIYYRKLAALIFLRNSGKPPFIKIIQRCQSFSEGHCDHDPSDSIGQFDPSGKDGENICHLSKCHDPSAQEDTGKKSIKEQSKGSAWNVPAIEEKKITTYNAKKRNIFI